MVVTPADSTDAFLPVNTIYELLFEANSKRDAVVLVDARNPHRFYTVADLEKRVLLFARLLQDKYNWKAGDVLAICAANNASSDEMMCSFPFIHNALHRLD